MSVFSAIAVFFFGTAIGSFLNVLASRYSEKTGFKKAFKGRSKCDQCKKTLRWYELVPILSYLFLLGKCRSCKKPIPWQYTLVELLAGFLALGVFIKLGAAPLALIWTTVLWALLLMSVIDIRLKIIPDTLVVLILILSVGKLIYQDIANLNTYIQTQKGVDLLGHYSILATSQNALINYVIAILVGIALFGGIYYFSRGKAMGLGDVKLVGALGFLIAWPDIIVALIMPFLIGSAVGVPLILSKKLKFKSSIPFGPYIAIGVILTFFFGYNIVNAYFEVFNFI